MLVQEYGSRPRVIGRTGLRRLKRAWAAFSPAIGIIGGNATFRHVCDRRFLTQTVNNCFCGKLLQGAVICIYSPGTVLQGMRVPVRMESDTQGISPVFFLSAVLWKFSAVSGVFLIPCRTVVKGRAPDVSSWGYCFKMAPEPIWF